VRFGDLIAAETWLRSHLEEVRAGIMELATTEDGEGGRGDRWRHRRRGLLGVRRGRWAVRLEPW
jgi:hypothetical protein